MLRTATYIRVSTDKQAREGDSVAAQRDALNKYIADHANLIHAGEYLDDGISGTKFDRDAFQALLEDVKAGKVDLILITKMDRLHRSLRNFLNTQELLDKHNVTWLAIWEPVYDSGTPQGRLIINQLMSIAQFEAENTGQRIRQVMDYKIQQGDVVSGKIPLGYKIENKRLVFSEDADIVRSAFEFYSKTGNLCQTQQFLNHFGFHRHTTSVKTLLKNRKYIGENRGNSNYCPALISTELFEDVQRKLAMNTKINQRYHYIFTGLLVCGECGHRMYGQSHAAGRQYKCYQHYSISYRRCDNTRTILEKTLEKYMVEMIKPLTENYIREVTAVDVETDNKEREIANLHKKVERLKELYINDLITMDEYKADKERYLSEIAELESIARPEPVDVAPLQALLEMDFEESYATWTNEQKQLFWRSFLKEIRFDKNRKITPIFL